MIIKMKIEHPPKTYRIHLYNYDIFRKIIQHFFRCENVNIINLRDF